MIAFVGVGLVTGGSVVSRVSTVTVGVGTTVTGGTVVDIGTVVTGRAGAGPVDGKIGTRPVALR
jgi:hypothetical protein